MNDNDGKPKKPKTVKSIIAEAQQAFTEAYVADFKEHAAGVIAIVRKENPVAYLKHGADMLPRQVTLAGDPDNPLFTRIDRLIIEPKFDETGKLIPFPLPKGQSVGD